MLSDVIEINSRGEDNFQSPPSFHLVIPQTLQAFQVIQKHKSTDFK